MIPGREPLKIRRYLPIDHLSEGVGWVRPVGGVEFLGIPHGWYGEGSAPFIEVRSGGAVLETLNCADMSAIEFFE